MDDQSAMPPITFVLSQSPYFSPLLAQLPQEMLPDPLPACASCPASLWRATTERFECVCLTMHRLSWDGRQMPTMFCDGREAAIARLKKEQTEP